MAGYVYPYDVDSVLQMLDLDLTKEQRERVDAVVGALVERDRDLEGYLGRSRNGEADTTAITAAAGGATITFTKQFTVTPVVVVSSGTAGYYMTTTAVGTSTFKVRVYDAAGVEQAAGAFDVNWIATA